MGVKAHCKIYARITTTITRETIYHALSVKLVLNVPQFKKEQTKAAEKNGRFQITTKTTTIAAATVKQHQPTTTKNESRIIITTIVLHLVALQIKELKNTRINNNKKNQAQDRGICVDGAREFLTPLTMCARSALQRYF
ncbi:unnamed protein product [Ceratitis capitata]|uniref:(Mediterranean fruit fly) hypothetical protein n=1 Tax=Ceratitis capitata TaxID=7213 RepID=A0A811UIE9_CERCA|nr:unnamed protein product [Ceratitis capitata]